MVRFSLASPRVWLELFGLSCLPWGLFVPGGGPAPRPPDAMEWFCCGRCLLRARTLLAAGTAASAAPTSLRCLFGGSSDQSLHR